MKYVEQFYHRSKDCGGNGVREALLTWLAPGPSMAMEWHTVKFEDYYYTHRHLNEPSQIQLKDGIPNLNSQNYQRQTQMSTDYCICKIVFSTGCSCIISRSWTPAQTWKSCPMAYTLLATYC